MLGNFDRADAATRTGAARGLALAGRNALNVSNLTIPWEEGDLSRDGVVEVDDAALEAAVSYGHDPLNAVKAVVNHEDMNRQHDPGRGPKFLENALNQTASQNAAIIAGEIRRELGT